MSNNNYHPPKPGFRPATTEEIAELQYLSDNLYSKFSGRLTETEVDALNAYTVGAYEQINELLYEAFDEHTDAMPEYQEKIHLIDSAMEIFALPFDITVYRGAHAKHYADFYPGCVKSIPAFLSTSVTREMTDVFCERVMGLGENSIKLEIFVPKGTRSIYIGNNTDYPKPQDELLLGRGLKYRIIEKNEDSLKMEVLP